MRWIRCSGCEIARRKALNMVHGDHGYGDVIVECKTCRRQWVASIKERERRCMVCHDRGPAEDSSLCIQCK